MTLTRARAVRRALAVSVLVVASVLTASSTPASGRAAAAAPADVPRRGVVHEGLEPAPPTSACAGLLVVSVDGRELCTHGPDPAPDGVDVSQRRAPERAPTAAQGPSPFACFGNGSDGPRVQVIYARAANVVDRYAAYAASFATWTARVEQIVQASAAETGGVRHVRFLTDPACNLVVDRVVLSATGDDTFQDTVNDLWARGYNRSDRRYLIYVDANVYCGLGSLLADDRPGAANLNNGLPTVSPTFARVDNGCWGLADSAEAHEVMHTLGSVQPTAPHGTPGYHCSDDFDRMCGDDGSGTPMRFLCPLSHEPIFDCNHDDYFSTNPVPGSWLATHWNVADSVFLGSVDVASPAMTWGYDGYGQLGVGTAANRPAPVVVGLAGVGKVAAGGYHSLAVSGGRVWSWGLGHVGQLGRPWPAASSSSPGVVGGLTDVVAVAAGTYHSLALRADGTVWAWGWNVFGQLGDGTTVDRWQPVQVAGLTGVTEISAGVGHSLARTADGAVWSWGYNGFGQLGRGGAPLVAAKVAGVGVGATSIAAGGYHSLAAGPDGRTVFAWGWNPWGQVGDGSVVDRAAPVVVAGLTGVASVAAGLGHSLAVGRDGSVRSWGLGHVGQLGRTAASSPVASLVPGLAGVTAVAAGGFHSVALGAGGRGLDLGVEHLRPAGRRDARRPHRRRWRSPASPAPGW